MALAFMAGAAEMIDRKELIERVKIVRRYLFDVSDGKDAEHDMAQGLGDVMAFLFESTVLSSQWISVNERLPEDGAKVLAVNAIYSREPYVALYREGDNSFPFTSYCGLFASYISDVDTYAAVEVPTHWAELPPLPEPPTELGE